MIRSSWIISGGGKVVSAFLGLEGFEDAGDGFAQAFYGDVCERRRAVADAATLSEDEFTHDATGCTVRELIVHFDGKLELDVTSSPTERQRSQLTLNIGVWSFPLASADFVMNSKMRWYGTTVVLSPGAAINVNLTPNEEDTAAPELQKAAGQGDTVILYAGRARTELCAGGAQQPHSARCHPGRADRDRSRDHGR